MCTITKIQLALTLLFGIASTSHATVPPHEALYVWIDGSSTCYQLEAMPTITYHKQGTENQVWLTMPGSTTPLLSLPLDNDHSQLMITYGQYINTTLALNRYGLSTFSCTSPVRFVQGATPYTVTIDKSEQTITCTPIADGIVPAYTGVLLKAADGNAEAHFTILDTNSTLSQANHLKPTSTSTGTADIEPSYVLSGNVFGTYDGTKFTTGKAYLPASGTHSRQLSIIWNEHNNETSISDCVQDQDTHTLIHRVGKYIYGEQLIVIHNTKQFDINGKPIN